TPVLVNATTEAWLEEGSRLEVLEVQAQPVAVDHVGHFFVRQASRSRLAACTLAQGARLARHEMLVDLAAEEVSCRVDGVAVASGQRHVDFVTRVDHRRPRGTSRQLFKAILDGHATSAFSGLVQVHPHAVGTDARQSNHNMLLSPDAQADSKPQLEIYADDVKCAHGATVGQLDDTAVFYLRSRGLDKAEARALLVKAFAAEVADRIEEPVLRRYARMRLDAVL
ncbi:MAG: Fe-S cluster assembly protein SufD, partial [Planctomycetota bacterium]